MKTIPQPTGNAATPEAQLSPHVQARILAEALPHLIRYDDQTVVIKFGGHAMGDDALAAAFAQDIVYLKQSGVNPIVVHGGGPQIGEMLDRLHIASDFVQGLRVTDEPTVKVVEMVLAGGINKDIVSAINRQGGKAVGICGKDANLMIARQHHADARPQFQRDEVGRYRIRRRADRGQPAHRRGDLEIGPHPRDRADRHRTRRAKRSTSTPTPSPARSPRGMRAKRLLLLTDVQGVLDKDKRLVEELTIEEARTLIKDGVITGGMIPKIEGCIEVVEAGVEAVVIIDGRVPHCVLLELFTDTRRRHARRTRAAQVESAGANERQRAATNNAAAQRRSFARL